MSNVLSASTANNSIKTNNSYDETAGNILLFPTSHTPAIAKPARGHVAADAIRDAETMRAVLRELRNSGKYWKRNLMIFWLGVRSGRRCGDLLNLQLKEVWDMGADNVRESIEYWDQKTRRWLRFYLDAETRSMLYDYIRELGCTHGDDYIFPSRKGSGPMSVTAYGNILRAIRDKLGLDMHLSTHSMRKTFGYNGFRQCGAEFVTMALGHYNMKNTVTYLGLDQEYLQDKYTTMHIAGLEKD